MCFRTTCETFVFRLIVKTMDNPFAIPSTSNSASIPMSNSNPISLPYTISEPPSFPPTLSSNPYPTYDNDQRVASSPALHPIGEHREGRIGLTLRDIQTLTTSKVIGLYDCIHDVYERNDDDHVDLFSIVNIAWSNPILHHACSSKTITEVLIKKLF